MSLSPAQCRAARGLVGWSQADLAGASSVATKTLADFERGARVPYDRTLADIERALEAKGVEFIPENGGGAGVRLRKAVAAAADHEAHIETLKANLPHVDEAAPPSPAKGMKQLERAHGKNEIVKAKSKRPKGK